MAPGKKLRERTERTPCCAPLKRMLFLERTKAAREERQLEKIRGEMEGWEQWGRHVVTPGKK